MNVARIVSPVRAWTSVLATVTLLASAPLLVSFLSPAAPAAAQGTKLYENTDFGYKLRAPKEWTQVPLQLEEKWLTARWLSNRAYMYTEPNGGWTHEHKPELTVIAFIDDVVKRKATIEKKADEKGRDVVIIDIKNPYKNYLDYLERTNRDGGFHVAAEKTVEIDGRKVTQYEIKIEKLTYNGPKRIITWVHQTDEVDFAVEYVCFESAYEKLEKEISSVQKSFGLIARSSAGLATGETGESVVFDERELTAEKRKERRVGLEKQAHAKAKSSALEGWETFEVGRVLVLNHADVKYAKRVAEQASAVLDWCDETFPYVGPEEYVRKPVLRVCASEDEERAFSKGSGFYFGGGRLAEIVTHDDKEGFLTSWEVDWVNQAALRFWFQERDLRLWLAMPDWLATGLPQLVAKSRVDKGKLGFRQDDYGRDQLRLMIKEGKAAAPRELLRLATEDFNGQDFESYFGSRYQSGALLRFLVAGDGARNAKTRDVLATYVKTLNSVVGEIAKKEEAEGKGEPKKPKTEEEEEAYYKEVNQGWKQKERSLIDETFERTFRTWKDSEWAAFSKIYFESV